MIKTIKVKKQLRLDELIKCVWEGRLPAKIYTSDRGLKEVHIYPDTIIFTRTENDSVAKADTFTVEVEEEITKDTRFKGVQEIYIDDEGVLQVERHPILARKSLNDVLEEHDEETECLYIYAAVGGKTELIWEAGSE